MVKVIKMTNTVKVIIKRNVSDDEINESDIDLPLEVEIEINSSVKLVDFASCALDVFHSNFAVKILEDFNFIVKFNNEEIYESDDSSRENYDFANDGEITYTVLK
jgi:hypothetical protein